MNRKKEDFLQLEEIFTQLKKKQNTNSNLRGIERILSRQFGGKFNVSIINNTRNFYGMTVYPNKDDMQKIISLLLGENETRALTFYKDIDEWFIEIDSKLLYDTRLNANPAECVAVLMHEIGHVKYSNSVPAKLSKVILVDYLLLNNKVKNLVKNGKLQKLLGITAMEAFALKSFSSDPLKSEKIADKFAVKMGYGENLLTFVNKLLQSNGNSLIDVADEQIENDIKIINTWTIENISELQYRKTKLRNSLKTELLSNPSNFVREYIGELKAMFFGSDAQSLMKQMVVEQALMTEYNKIINESFIPLFDKFGKVKKVTQSQIDDLLIDVNRVDNFDDCKYTLSKIQDTLEIVNLGLELIDNKHNEKVYVSKSSLQSFKKQLEDMRMELLHRKFKKPRNIILINYPEGYEG